MKRILFLLLILIGFSCEKEEPKPYDYKCVCKGYEREMRFTDKGGAQQWCSDSCQLYGKNVCRTCHKVVGESKDTISSTQYCDSELELVQRYEFRTDDYRNVDYHCEN